MDAAQRSAFIDAWIEYERMSISTERQLRLQAETDHGWASTRMVLLPMERPELAWELIFEILARNPDVHVRTMLAAGPLQTIVSSHSKIFADRIEEQARRNPEFRELLGGLIAMPDFLYQRIQHLLPQGR